MVEEDRARSNGFSFNGKTVRFSFVFVKLMGFNPFVTCLVLGNRFTVRL